MRSTAAILLIVAFLVLAAVPAVAQEGSGDSTTLTPLEQLEEMRRQFDEAVRASQQATSTVQGPATDASSSETIRKLRLQVQDLTYENAQLVESSEQAAREASETAAALAAENVALRAQVASLEEQVAELQAEVDEKRPLFWRDPADWAAILGGLAVGALIGVGLSSRRRADRHPAAEERPVSAPPGPAAPPNDSSGIDSPPADAEPPTEGPPSE